MQIRSKKLKKLKEILKKMDSVLIAYSGGVDSNFLVKVALDTLGRNKVLAVTADSVIFPKEELIFSCKMAKLLGLKHKIIKTKEFKDKRFIANLSNRCYFCKQELFRKLKNIAQENKINFVIDGSNISDKKDFRPGEKAKKEYKIRSPLQEAGFTKEDIRYFSKRLGLITWNKPTLACLASRIPYGIKISSFLLKKINSAERFLRRYGFSTVRVRHYHHLCRIEVLKEDIPRLIKQVQRIVSYFKKLGYQYVTVDLEGYRTGSLNLIKHAR